MEYTGRNPMEIYEEEVARRPVPAIEKPLGPRGVEAPPEVIIVEDLGGLTNWNDNMRGREWTG